MTASQADNALINEMNRSIGTLIGTVNGITQSVDSLNRVWGERELAASNGRAAVYAKVEEIRLDLVRYGAEVENVSRDMVDVRKAIAEYKTERAGREGAQRLGKKIWVGVAGIVGAGTAEVIHKFFH